MLLTFSNIKAALAITYSEKKFYLLTAITAIGVISLLNLAINISLIQYALFGPLTIEGKLKLIIAIIEGTFYTNKIETLILVGITGLLAGINTSLIAYKINESKKIHPATGIMGTIGTLLGLIASGCSSCALSILSLFGVVGGLSFLPYGGTELTIIGIIILLYTLKPSSESVLGICRVVKKETKIAKN